MAVLVSLLGDDCTPDCVCARWVVPLVSHREWHYTSLAIGTSTVGIKVFFFLIRIQNVTQQTSNEVRNRVFCESHIGKEYRIIRMLSHISIYACIYVFTYYMQKWTPCSYIQTHPQITHYLFLDSFVMNIKSFFIIKMYINMTYR